jgi:hypothetical protein
MPASPISWRRNIRAWQTGSTWGRASAPAVHGRRRLNRNPEGPGLGIEVDEQALAALAYDGVWESPTLMYDDGSLADW